MACPNLRPHEELIVRDVLHADRTTLQVLCEPGRPELDNNRAERSIKPFVMGRKNWLVSNTSKGARASALVYSIIETAKENGLHPFHYLSYLFEQLPNLERVAEEALDLLLPWSETIPSEYRLSIEV